MKIMPINSITSKHLHWHWLGERQPAVVRGILAKIRDKRNSLKKQKIINDEEKVNSMHHYENKRELKSCKIKI
jgi:hypothetical protein